MTALAESPRSALQKRGNPSLVLPEVLRDLYVSRRTGLLHVLKGGDRVSFRFINGEVVNGFSTSERGRLGETMVRHEMLTREDLERALGVVLREKRRLGPVLREMGILDASRLEQALALHILEMLSAAVGWDEATHVFEDQELPEEASEDLTLRCTTGELILEVVRRISDSTTVRQGLGDVNRVLLAVPRPPFRLDRITLSPADAYVLSRVDGATSAREIVEITPLQVADVERSLLGLLCTGVITYRPVAIAPVRTRTTERGVVETKVTENKVAESRVTGQKPPAPSPRSAEMRRTVESAYESRTRRDHFQILGVPRSASADEVKEAFVKLVKAFHPDRNRDAAPDLLPKLQAVFTRIHEAYHVLGSPDRKARYEAGLKPPRPTPDVPRVVVVVQKDNPAPPAPRAEAAPAEASGPEAIGAAEAHIAEGRYWEAQPLLESVAAQATGSLERRARHLLAKSYLMNPESARKAEGEFLRIIRLDPSDVEAHHSLGKFYLERSLPARAKVMFQKTLELQPGHRNAQAELAALRPAPEADSKSLLGKLLQRRIS